VAPIDAVVLGSGLNALGILRSLGGRGVNIALVSRSASVIPGYSRFARRHLVLDDGDYEPAAVLAGTGLARGQAALFITDELDTAACLSNVAAWNEAFRTYFYTPGVAAALLDKTGFDALARSRHAPVPKTFVIGPGDVPVAAEGLRFPLIVKPALRDPRYDAHFRKAYRVADEPALAGLLDELRQVHVPLIVQEWVEGRDSDIYFNLVCSSFVGRKILCWPPRVGGTASCVAAPECHEQLTAITAAFLKDINFRGLLGMEYKQDPRDGEFYMIEPTVYRTDYQHEIATLSGVEFLFGVYARMRGLSAQPRRNYDRRSYWVDNPAARYAVQSQEDGSAVDPAAKRVDAWFRGSDPLPGIIHYGRLLAARLENAFRKFLAITDNKRKSKSNA
jgi:D-aspartate ligase